MRSIFPGDKVHMLIRKGAEASIFLEDWRGRRVIMKTRLPKSYRVRVLDDLIRVTRTSREAHLLHYSKQAGVPTPTVYQVDRKTCTIVMEYLTGPRLKEALSQMDRTDLKRTARLVGSLIGRLHSGGIVHGDLTTSNMILVGPSKLFFIDYGLSDYSNELEARGVDLLLMSRAFKSTHFSLYSNAFRNVVEGYKERVGDTNTSLVLNKMREIEKRGRYSERSQTGSLPNQE